MIDNVAAVNICGDFDRHADADPAQLAFREVCIDKKLGDRNDHHDRVASRNPLPKLNLTAGDDASDRRADHGPLHIKPCGIYFGLRGKDRRIAVHVRATDQRVIGGILPLRRLLAGLRLLHGSARLNDGSLRGSESAAGSGQFLARDRTAGGQRLTPLQIDLGLGVIGLGTGQMCAGLCDIGTAHCDLRRKRPAGRLRLPESAPGARQIGLGLRQCDSGVCLIEHRQHFALFDRLGILHPQFDHRP